MVDCKSGGRKGCNDRWDVVVGHIGVVLHHVRSL